MKEILFPLLLTAAMHAADTLPIPTPAIDDPRSVTVGERSVVPVSVCQLQATILVLPEHELTRNTIVSDTENWVLETTASKQASRFVTIKVKKPLTTETPLTVITDHDSSYTFRLILRTDHCDSKVFIDVDSQLAKHIAETQPWASPEEVEKLKVQVEEAKKAAATAKTDVQTQVDAFRSTYPEKLRFDYRFSDEKLADKMGVRALFHDSNFTYASVTSQEMPTLYELRDGKPSLIAFDYRNGLYSTAGILKEGYLVFGGTGSGKHQEKLEFKRIVEDN